MKKQYLRISIAAFFFAAFIFSTSCSKKSSDDPKPTVTTTTPPATQQKQIPTTIKDKEDPKAGDGTVRESATNVTVNGTTVAVQAPTDNFKTTTLSSEGQTNLNNLLGVSNARLEGAFDFGWYVIKAETKINAQSYDLLEKSNNDTADSLKTVLFFDDEIPGIYYQYYYALDTNETGDVKYWDWGTYAVDKEVKVIAFDFDTNNVPESIWDIKFITSSNIVLKTNLVVDLATYPVTISLFGFDLQNGVTYSDNALQQELAKSRWYFNTYSDAKGVSYTANSDCKISSFYQFYSGFSYLFGNPIPCGDAFEGYYYLKKSGTQDIMIIYYPDFTNENGVADTDLYIEADVTLSNGILSLKYKKCDKISSYVGYIFNYNTTTPTLPTGVARKE